MDSKEFDSFLEELDASNNEYEEESPGEGIVESGNSVSEEIVFQATFNQKSETYKRLKKLKKKCNPLTLQKAYMVLGIDDFPADREMLRCNYYRFCMEVGSDHNLSKLLADSKKMIEENLSVNPFKETAKEMVNPEKEVKTTLIAGKKKKDTVFELSDTSDKDEATEDDIFKSVTGISNLGPVKVSESNTKNPKTTRSAEPFSYYYSRHGHIREINRKGYKNVETVVMAISFIASAYVLYLMMI